VVGAIIITIWMVFARVFRISSMAAIISFSALPFLIYWQEASLAITGIFSLMSAILIWRHKGNIERLLQGKES